MLISWKWISDCRAGGGVGRVGVARLGLGLGLVVGQFDQYGLFALWGTMHMVNSTIVWKGWWYKSTCTV